MHSARIGAAIAIALLLTGVAAKPAGSAAPSTKLRFTLPGGAAIFYIEALNPQAPLSQRSWQRAIFYFPNGARFGSLVRYAERVGKQSNLRSRGIGRV